MDNKNFWLYLIAALIAGILVGGGVVYFLNGNTGGTGSLNMYPPKSSADWLAKIDDYVITKADFDQGFMALMAQIPEDKKAGLPQDIKAQYFESLLKEYILSIKALNDGLQKDPTNQIMLKSLVRRYLSNLYLQKSAPLDKSGFMPSKMEMDAYYTQHKEELDKSGMKSDQMKQYIAQDIERQKEQAWIEQLVTTLRDSIKVQRNNAALLSEGVTLTPVNNSQLSPQSVLPSNSGK